MCNREMPWDCRYIAVLASNAARVQPLMTARKVTRLKASNEAVGESDLTPGFCS